MVENEIFFKLYSVPGSVPLNRFQNHNFITSVFVFVFWLVCNNIIPILILNRKFPHVTRVSYLRANAMNTVSYFFFQFYLYNERKINFAAILIIHIFPFSLGGVHVCRIVLNIWGFSSLFILNTKHLNLNQTQSVIPFWVVWVLFLVRFLSCRPTIPKSERYKIIIPFKCGRMCARLNDFPNGDER